MDSLDTASLIVSNAMRKGGGNSEHYMATLVNDVFWTFDPGVLHDVWYCAVSQVFQQELVRRRKDLAATEERNIDSSPSMRSSVVSRRRRAATFQEIGGGGLNTSAGAAGDTSRRGTKVAVSDPGSIETVDHLGQIQREKAWRSVFGRLSTACRLRRADLQKALNFVGVPNVNMEWVDSIYDSTAKASTISSDEFVKIARTYMEWQQLEYVNTFRAFDKDNGGTIDVVELKAVLNSYGMEPLPHVLKEVVSQIDACDSGALSMQEFVCVMDTIQTSEGFSQSERQELSSVFQRFDSGKSCIPTADLQGILSWLGHCLSASDVKAIAREVDVDHSGSLDLHEFLMCMGKVRIQEIKALKDAIRKFDLDGSGSLSFSELEPLLQALGHMADPQAVSDAATDAGADPSEMSFDDVWLFLKVYREREGLSSAECAQVDAAFERYDADASGEMSTSEVGKALRWFGYQVSFMMQQQIIADVDVDKSGQLSKAELRKLIRLYWEKELKIISAAFAKHSGTGDRCTLEEVEKAFRQIDFVDRHSKTPVVPLAAVTNDGVDRAKFVSIGIDFKKQQREMYRRNAGYKNQEVKVLQELFARYDKDRSDSINTQELGKLIRHVFPVLNKSIRTQLDLLMKEIDLDGPGTGVLSFEDFLRMMRLFHDIQNQERADKLELFIAEAKFSTEDVHGLREVFEMCDQNLDGELNEVELRYMLQNVCHLDPGNAADLHKMFTGIREYVTSQRGQKLEGSGEALDFPEFLLIMRKLIDANFGNIQTTLGFQRSSTHDFAPLILA